ncbi:MAG: hypothetical protein ACRCSY_06150 [Cetobacterium sp.]
MKNKIIQDIYEATIMFTSTKFEDDTYSARFVCSVGNILVLDIVTYELDFCESLKEMKSRMPGKHNDAINASHESFHELIDEIYFNAYKIIELEKISREALSA